MVPTHKGDDRTVENGECSCWSVKCQLLHDLHEFFLCGDTPVLLLEPGEFAHESHLLRFE